MTKLWAVVAKTYVQYLNAVEGENYWHEKEIILEFERAETQEEAEQSVKNRIQDTLKKKEEEHNTRNASKIVLWADSVLQAYPVPYNPAPPIPSWLEACN